MRFGNMCVGFRPCFEFTYKSQYVSDPKRLKIYAVEWDVLNVILFTNFSYYIIHQR